MPVRHPSPAGYQRADLDSAQHRARAAHRPVLHRRLQHAGAAGDLPPGGRLADRFSGAGPGVEFAQPGHGGSETLSQKHGDTEFLRPDHEGGPEPRTAGCRDFRRPQGDAGRGNSAGDAESSLREVKFPVFYMNYNLNPQINPWRDAIGNAVKYPERDGVHHQPSRAICFLPGPISWAVS